MKRERYLAVDEEFLNDITADKQDYPEIEEEFLKELKRNRYPKGL